MNPTPDDIRTVLEFAQAVALPKLADLTPEQKRVLIAEACGWTSMKVPPDDKNPYGEFQHTWWHDPKEQHENWCPRSLPNYLSDLNAMAEARKALTDEQTEKYLDYLTEVCGGDVEYGKASFVAYFADAAQHSDAFLLAVGKAQP